MSSKFQYSYSLVRFEIKTNVKKIYQHESKINGEVLSAEMGFKNLDILYKKGEDWEKLRFTSKVRWLKTDQLLIDPPTNEKVYTLKTKDKKHWIIGIKENTCLILLVDEDPKDAKHQLKKLL